MTDKDAEILEPLQPYIWKGKPHLPGYTGRVACYGRRGPVVFILTIDHDGQAEVSLSKYNPNKRPGRRA